MNLWILDTDHVSLFLEGNLQIRKQAAGKFPSIAHDSQWGRRIAGIRFGFNRILERIILRVIEIANPIAIPNERFRQKIQRCRAVAASNSTQQNQ